MKQEKLPATELNSFLSRCPYSVIHLDAKWDGYRGSVAEQISSITEIFNGVVSFGYIDVDENPDYAESIQLRNTPACAYFRGDVLIATVIGVKQDIVLNITLIQNGGIPDSTNEMSRF